MTDSFGEQWFSPESQYALVKLLRQTKGNGRIVEVGSWTGRSTCALANAASPEIVEAVDTWAGSPGEISADLAAERDVFAQFTENIDNFTRGNVIPYRMGWRDYFANDMTPIRFLFIDAEHTFREVYDNIEAALPMMTPGSIICGDDQHHPPIQEAVEQHFGTYNTTASLWWVSL